MSEKYAKIISKTIILSGIDAASFGQNAYFYDAAEGLLTVTILLVAEFCEPERRHIVSVFKIIQELLAPSQKKGKNQFQQLMEFLPDDHKAKWFAGAAPNTAEQSMASVMSTAFLDSELEQLLCFDTEIDAEKFCKEKCAIFLIMPEENPNTFFMISLNIQQFYREILDGIVKKYHPDWLMDESLPADVFPPAGGRAQAMTERKQPSSREKGKGGGTGLRTAPRAVREHRTEETVREGRMFQLSKSTEVNEDGKA